MPPHVSLPTHLPSRALISHLQGCKGLETGPGLAAATFDPERRLWLHGVAADGALLYMSLANAETLYLCTVRMQLRSLQCSPRPAIPPSTSRSVG